MNSNHLIRDKLGMGDKLFAVPWVALHGAGAPLRQTREEAR